MKKLLVGLLLLGCVQAVRGGEPSFAPITTGALDGVNGHIQGIACSDDAIYLSYIEGLLKIDWTGKVLKHVKARRHMGDVAFRDGKLYGTLGKTKDPHKGLGGTPYIQIFDADLNLVGEKQITSAPGIDGIAFLGDSIYVGGGSLGAGPKAHTTNLVVKLDAKMEHVASLKLDYGSRTKYGVQNATAADGKVWLFFYSAGKGEKSCAVLDADMKLVKAMDFKGGNGVDALPPRFGKSERPRFLVCRTLGYPIKKGVPVKVQLKFVEVVGDKVVELGK